MSDILPVHQNPTYGWLLIVGIIITLIVWIRMARTESRLFYIYLAALCSAFIGAKIVYILSEGFLYLEHPQKFQILMTGKSITGGLLFGFLGVEVTKRFLGYKKPTGDLFAIVVPLGIMMGRLGCLAHGCCKGKEGVYSFLLSLGFNPSHWPAPQFEFLFNFLALISAIALSKYKVLPNQHFHLYLISYGLFRFFHEYMRDTPKVFSEFSGYQLVSFLLVIVGILGFVIRKRRMQQMQ